MESGKHRDAPNEEFKVKKTYEKKDLYQQIQKVEEILKIDLTAKVDKEKESIAQKTKKKLKLNPKNKESSMQKVTKGLAAKKQG